MVDSLINHWPIDIRLTPVNIGISNHSSKLASGNQTWGAGNPEFCSARQLSFDSIKSINLVVFIQGTLW